MSKKLFYVLAFILLIINLNPYSIAVYWYLFYNPEPNNLNLDTNQTISKYADIIAIEKFLLQDDTDKIPYNSTNFNCEDYSNLLVRRLIEKGYFACPVSLTFTDGYGHILVAFKTPSNRIYYIEPQSDLIFPEEELQIGKDYCDIVKWRCKNWTIAKISSCFYISTFD